jgi:hypothetical protein
MIDGRFRVLNTLKAQFERHWLRVEIRSDTICVGRQEWDEYSRQFLTMVSAAPAIRAGAKSFSMYVIEQSDKAHILAKYVIKLCDSDGIALKSWDLDKKRGQHFHKYDNGTKLPDHFPHQGGIAQIADEIMEVMRMHPERDRDDFWARIGKLRERDP